MSAFPRSSADSKPIALIPVGLKEAALDSPTFRSSFSHVASQVDIIEKWLETWIKSVSKVTSEIAPLEGVMNAFLSQANPPVDISEAMLDHDYTLLSMKRYGEATRDIWTSMVFNMKKMEVNMVEPVRNLIQNDIQAFKDCRRVLEQSQKIFDGLLYRYSAQAKSKEPSSLREDAFQVHEARKAYLKASMDFSVMVPQLRMALDKTLIKITSDQWRDMRSSRESLSGSSQRVNSDIERVRSWSRELEGNEGAFSKELLNARKRIEDNVEMSMRPSRELEDYAYLLPSTTMSNANTMREAPTEDVQSSLDAEKQGWLYLRTQSGKPTKTVWVRRWFFVRNGVFGFLVQGSRSGGVEESQRIGVLLCNVKAAKTEERRFVFEVKTKDLSILLQAQSQAEMLSWLQAFEVAKRRALEDPASPHAPDSEGSGQDPSFAISSPPVPEFGANTTDFGMYRSRDDDSTPSLERGATLPVPGAEGGFSPPGRSSTDFGRHRGSNAGDESGRDHAARIIQKLDLHRKSTTNTSGPPPTGSASAGGIASLIAASHISMPVGPGVLPLSQQLNSPALRVAGLVGPSGLSSNSLAPNTLVNAPSPTSLSETAVIVSGERSMSIDRPGKSGGMPSGVLANIWGTSNWGFLNRLERGEVKSLQDGPAVIPSSVQNRSSDALESPAHPLLSSANLPDEAKPTAGLITSSPPHKRSTSTPNATSNITATDIKAVEYPSNYPLQLKVQDAQFKLLFPNVSRTEQVLLVFRAAWSLNDQQEFPGRIYVTLKNVYFYSHHLGLVLTSVIELDTISDVTSAPGRDYDLLFMHLKEPFGNTTSTRITVKAFLEPLKLVEYRLNLIIESRNTGGPSEMEAVLKRLMDSDRGHHTDSPHRDLMDDFTATSDEGRIGRNEFAGSHRDLRAAVLLDEGPSSRLRRFDGNKDASKIKLPRQPVLYIPEGMDRKVVDKIFNVSPKALFHVLFGDKSALWQLLYAQQHGCSKVSVSLTCENVTHERIGLIKHQALKDLRWDAVNLSDLITDQAGRLGAHSRTHKAVQIFGEVGRQTQTFEFAGSDVPISTRAIRRKRRTLIGLLANAVGSSVQHVLKSVILRLMALGRWAWNTFHANMVIMAIMAVSVVVNLVLTSTGTTQWWQDRRVGNYVARIGIGSGTTMSKVVYLQDTYDDWDPQIPRWDASEGRCRDAFESYLSGTDAQRPQVSASALTPRSAGQASIGRLQRSRERLGMQRHDLMVALRVVNSMEQEMVEAEWEGWLYNERVNCRRLDVLLHTNRTGLLNNGDRRGTEHRQPSDPDGLNYERVRSWHEEYCSSCTE
ncbi:MAG: hypothetical protein Q9220_001958 [cf. Caloplaca sp. 1 TL-2023]